jgi:hypothetical protein
LILNGRSVLLVYGAERLFILSENFFLIFVAFCVIIFLLTKFAGVMELADVTDSKSVGLIIRVGSSPTTGTRKRRLLSQSSFSMKFVPCGTSEILLRNVKYASRMKYACGI